MNVLEDAFAHCSTHDELLAQYAKEDEAARRRCKRGGQARHRNHRRIQLLTIRFLRTMAPASLWKSKVQAAEMIGPHLCMLAMKYKFAVSYSEETWVRNVGTMLRADPRAAQIFLRHCTSRRTMAAHGISGSI